MTPVIKAWNLCGRSASLLLIFETFVNIRNVRLSEGDRTGRWSVSKAMAKSNSQSHNKNCIEFFPHGMSRYLQCLGFFCWCFKVGCKAASNPPKADRWIWKFITCAGATSDRERRKAAPRQVDHNLVSCFFFLSILLGKCHCFHLQLYLETPATLGGAFLESFLEISRKQNVAQMPGVAWERRDSWQLAGSSDPSGDFCWSSWPQDTRQLTSMQFCWRSGSEIWGNRPVQKMPGIESILLKNRRRYINVCRF